MLTLHRASAGSGKTFTLAKTYIKDFIAIKKEDGSYRLRTKEEITDSHSHILAVTFTNKATNEMKQRIVEKLADIAGVTDKPISKIDYLADFVNELSVSENEIREIAKVGLQTLLYNYTDFQVSTIDSFFQMVMRTFANEIDLNDSYQVELNDNYVSQIGVDSTLTTVKEDNGKDAQNISFWLRLMINERIAEGKGWNVFAKSNTGMQSLYSDLLHFSQRMQKEEFKTIQQRLLSYFDECGDFKSFYLKLRQIAIADLNEYRAKCVNAINDVQNRFETEGLTVAECCIKGISTDFSELLAYRGFDVPRLKDKKTRDQFIAEESSLFLKTKNSKGILDSKFPGIDKEVRDIYKFAKDWKIAAINWKCNIEKLHYLGLLQSFLKNSQKFREEHNVVPIGDTNQILRRIINEDDTPFIYERIGTYLNHYLIDEFQDTSLLQWENLRPLIAEGISNGYDNLIIGDAKQSIYRFRNAEPDLITSIVPKDFDCTLHGESVKENTNWRSSKEVVMFNNTLFSAMTDLIDAKSGTMVDSSRRRLSVLYGNIVQQVHHKDVKGYIKIDFIKKAKKEDKKQYYYKMGDLIIDMLSRGYEQKDIAFLVSRNEEGVELISSLMRYNKESEQIGRQQIKIISEESLKLSESNAVKMIVAMLELIVKGLNTSDGDKETEKYHKIGVTEFCCNYNYFSIKCPSLSPSEIIDKVLEDKLPTELLDQKLRTMQSVALPAIVETIVENYVPDSLRRSDVAYIAAFQDIVIDYCDSYPSDIASFLKWWDLNGFRTSISSPEGADAVQVMTIHKSKGLEFKCVIIPSADWAVYPVSHHEDFLWIKPSFPKDVSEIDLVPPYIPIVAKTDLLETPYAKYYLEYVDKGIVDNINKTYVAFTRAIDEMHIFAFCGKDNIADVLESTLENMNSFLSYKVDKSLLEYMLSRDDFNFIDIADNHRRIEIGEPCKSNENECVETINDNENVEKDNEQENDSNIPFYYVNSQPQFLQYKDDSSVDLFDDEDPDPRSEGNLLHLIMSEIKEISDVDRAVLKLKVRGLLPPDKVIEYTKKVKTALCNESVLKWFSPDLKVFNERSIFGVNKLCKFRLRETDSLIKRMWRPDRMILTPDNKLIVVDYKFGHNADVDTNRRKMAEYLRLIKSTGQYESITGYLWYVSLGIIEEVSVDFPKIRLQQQVL